MTPTSIVAYLVLFTAVGGLVLFGALLLGRFLRPRVPSAAKLEPYECGEPPVGSSFVQFDLRFYVVALVFIIFEVEVAFFFPWAVVFGKSTQVMALASAERSATAAGRTAIEGKMSELGVSELVAAHPDVKGSNTMTTIAHDAHSLALMAMVEMAVFFVVLLVGFAYVWSQGDLDWVRTMTRD